MYEEWKPDHLLIAMTLPINSFVQSLQVIVSVISVIHLWLFLFFISLLTPPKK